MLRGGHVDETLAMAAHEFIKKCLSNTTAVGAPCSSVYKRAISDSAVTPKAERCIRHNVWRFDRVMSVLWQSVAPF